MDRTARRFLVTGGAGFIGSAVVRHLIRETKHEVVVFDKLTYAGNLASLAPVSNDPRYRFVTGDITDATAVRRLFEAARPDVVLNLAAESHVDRSINGAAAFVQTNIVGTYVLLEAARAYLSTLPRDRQPEFRFLHISTDEVFGSLGETGRFSEATPYQPNSPYSASKASSDHLVRAWHHTYGLPVLLTNCSNNYGPYQFPEKLIPLIVLNCLEGKELPVYGQGENVRDWLFVDDHVRALLLVAAEGRVGESYNVGGDSEVRNIDVVQAICDIVDRLAPGPGNPPTCLPDPLRDRSTRSRPALRDRRDQDRKRAGLGLRRHRSPPAWSGRSAGISRTAPGGSRSAPKCMPAAGWGWSVDPRLRRRRTIGAGTRGSCRQGAPADGLPPQAGSRHCQ